MELSRLLSFFNQFYSIHGFVHNSVQPLVYVLLPGRSKAVYVNMIGQIENLVEGFNPSDVICDFEVAFINAVRNEIPGTSITGCFLHLCQSIWRKIQGLGADIQMRYRDDAEFSLRCRMLPALAFVPPTMVRKVFEKVALILRREEPSLVSLLGYFETNYIGTVVREPRFGIEIWNQWIWTEEHMRGTNNNVEGGT